MESSDYEHAIQLFEGAQIKLGNRLVNHRLYHWHVPNPLTMYPH